MEYFEDVYPLSSSTKQRCHFNAEANRYGHGSRLPNLPQQSEKSRPFLESIQSSHQLENKELHSPAEWTEKESVPVLNTNHEQDYNRTALKQTQFRVKGKFNKDRKEEWWSKITITVNIYSKIMFFFLKLIIMQIKMDPVDLSSHQVIQILQIEGLERAICCYRNPSKTTIAKIMKSIRLRRGMTKPKEMLLCFT